ncbi:hypothetical protein HJC04_21860 [Rhizobium sp. NLR8a]|uniref:hypothetical protein n=1 Tax=Rhizobium sp. NLR8a TaxID=2731119 RepID=UPI001C8336EA|nr:hypothetical protein [Rhizobium sp. NLR8a]MBX5222939.1 hypothetical protein [Rhizobium sp. NLR8a]
MTVKKREPTSKEPKKETADARKSPPAGPHAKDHLIDESKTPGAGALSEKDDQSITPGSG